MKTIHSRWFQLVIGILCMGLVANLQYAWTLFVNPMHLKTGWSLTAIQLSFSIFILVETWLVPIEGWMVDKLGPRFVVMLGAVFAALGWLLDGYATTLEEIYLAAVISGIGAGCVYGTCVGNAVKWFPDKRGLAAGLTAAGFGAGAALSVIPIGNMITNSGYQEAFIFFGILQGVCIFLIALMMIRPNPQGIKAATRHVTIKINIPTSQMVRKPLFWFIYLIFVSVAAGGLMVTAQIAPMAKDYGLDKLPIVFFGATFPLLTLTLSIDNLANGFTRPLCGFISDLIGRETTMLFVFIGEGLAMLGMITLGHDPIAFIVFAALIFLFWGEIFSIFPAICTDTFGAEYAAGNAGLLYTAKGTASLLVPIASLISSKGNWDLLFQMGAVVSIVAGISCKFILEPWRRRFIAKANEGH
jgi:OFA family oxalate/formate antiporter-like MFS transporter